MKALLKYMRGCHDFFVQYDDAVTMAYPKFMWYSLRWYFKQKQWVKNWSSGTRYWHSLAALSTLTLSSCVVANGNMVASLGGETIYKGRDFGLVSSHSQSFRDAAVLAGLAVGAWQSVAATKATEATSQIATKSAAKTAQQKIAADAAVETAKINAGTEALKITTPAP